MWSAEGSGIHPLELTHKGNSDSRFARLSLFVTGSACDSLRAPPNDKTTVMTGKLAELTHPQRFSRNFKRPRRPVNPASFGP